MGDFDRFKINQDTQSLLQWAEQSSTPEAGTLLDAYNRSLSSSKTIPPRHQENILKAIFRLMQDEIFSRKSNTNEETDDIQSIQKFTPFETPPIVSNEWDSSNTSSRQNLTTPRISSLKPEIGRVIPEAHVTTFFYGRDNAYAGHPDGSDHVAFTFDKLRRKKISTPKGDEIVHLAKLGKGTFDDPSSMAVHPKSGVAYGSKVYVSGMGWFMVEDHSHNNTPDQTFDMWIGKSSKAESDRLTGNPKRTVWVYKPDEEISPDMQERGPSTEWLKHYNSKTGKK